MLWCPFGQTFTSNGYEKDVPGKKARKDLELLSHQAYGLEWNQSCDSVFEKDIL